MNTAQLSAWFAANKPVVIGAGAAGAVGLGLLARRRAGGDVNSAASGASSAATTAGGFSAGGQVSGVSGGGSYDSTASDLYSSLSPELSGIAQSLAKLNEANTGASTPTPVPAAPAPAAPNPAAGLKDGFYGVAGTPNRYRISGGKIDFLSHKEYLAMTKGQKVTVKMLSKDNPVLSNGAHWLDKGKQTPPTPVTVTK